MYHYISVLKHTCLFCGIGDNELPAILKCLQAELCTHKKGNYIYRQGEHITKLAILLKGKLLMQKEDFWGNRSIIQIINVGEMFGESYLAPESGALQIDILAEEDSEILLLDVPKILTLCPSACKFHSTLVQNLFFAISHKNQKLIQKLDHISKRTTRSKLNSYLSAESLKNNSDTFDIPFNRQQLADYLSVDRSAMSNELCKMRDEGLLTFDKNKFTLLQYEEV